ncbi:hypothetical protein HYPSUDRAFT_209187 [Hypholoma sublateritium FD-334 SS-4]|uniref:Uncharacterized protein n=1 Tax=Hypholoma sublateritium (strain FD-334 SS-4) TaxID=945553 RepID=A0A0D2NBD9_HYPSF|nr:hypothetical protein HYPSUDRAFT_209187 [Hypholoma sublateritium FD-334 SS-4]
MNTNSPATDKTTPKQRNDIIKQSQSTIKCKNSATAWMIDNNFIADGEAITATTISSALLLMASSKNMNTNSWINGTRAAAICIEYIHTENIIANVTKDASHQIQEATTKVSTDVAELIKTAIQHMEQSEELRGKNMEEEMLRRKEEQEQRRKDEQEAREKWLTLANSTGNNPNADAENLKKTLADTVATYATALKSSNKAPRTQAATRLELDIETREAKRSKSASATEILDKVNDAWKKLADADVHEGEDFELYDKPEGRNRAPPDTKRTT